jgi:hypothetical protein
MFRNTLSSVTINISNALVINHTKITTMGFDIKMAITAECDIDAFFEHCQELTNKPSNQIKVLILKKWVSSLPDMSEFFDNLELSFDDYRVGVAYHTNKAFVNVKGVNIPLASDSLKHNSNKNDDTSSDGETDNITELSDNDTDKNQIDGNESDKNELGSCEFIIDGVGNMSEYITWLFFEILINAKRRNHAIYLDYCRCFEQLDEYLKIVDDKIKIYLHSECSYKGSTKLEIDYTEISSDVEAMKANYGPTTKIYTKLSIV